MFTERYFPTRYFPPRYFDKTGAASTGPSQADMALYGDIHMSAALDVIETLNHGDLTSLSSATVLTSITGGIPAATTQISVQAYGGDVRITMDGTTTPSNTRGTIIFQYQTATFRAPLPQEAPAYFARFQAAEHTSGGKLAVRCDRSPRAG